jgi:hypothetical protein
VVTRKITANSTCPRLKPLRWQFGLQKKKRTKPMLTSKNTQQNYAGL